MTKFHVYFGGVRAVEITGKTSKEKIEDVMWSKHAIYAEEITRITEVDNDDVG